MRDIENHFQNRSGQATFPNTNVQPNRPLLYNSKTLQISHFLPANSCLCQVHSEEKLDEQKAQNNADFLKNRNYRMNPELPVLIGQADRNYQNIKSKLKSHDIRLFQNHSDEGLPIRKISPPFPEKNIQNSNRFSFSSSENVFSEPVPAESIMWKNDEI